MIASSSTFRPHSGRVIRDLFRLLDAVTALYGSTSLQQSSKGSCSLLVSCYNLRADCQWRTLVPPLNSGTTRGRQSTSEVLLAQDLGKTLTAAPVSIKYLHLLRLSATYNNLEENNLGSVASAESCRASVF